MRVSDFERVVCVTVDTRFPGWSLQARREVESKGAECQFFLNGSSRVDEIGREHYAQVNGEVPAGYRGPPGAYHLAVAVKAIIRQAKDDGLERLLIVEDDVVFTPEYDAVLGGIRVPDDWGMFYFGANHNFHVTDEVAPNLLRVHGSWTTHCAAFHRRAYDLILGATITDPIDVLFGAVHEAVPCYAAWPSVALQRPGPSTISGGEHADYAAWFKSKGKNWGGATQPPAKRVRIPLAEAKARGMETPKSGCGCGK